MIPVHLSHVAFAAKKAAKAPPKSAAAPMSKDPMHDFERLLGKHNTVDFACGKGIVLHGAESMPNAEAPVLKSARLRRLKSPNLFELDVTVAHGATLMPEPLKYTVEFRKQGLRVCGLHVFRPDPPRFILHNISPERQKLANAVLACVRRTPKH